MSNLLSRELCELRVCDVCLVNFLRRRLRLEQVADGLLVIPRQVTGEDGSCCLAILLCRWRRSLFLLNPHNEHEHPRYPNQDNFEMILTWLLASILRLCHTPVERSIPLWVTLVVLKCMGSRLDPGARA